MAHYPSPKLRQVASSTYTGCSCILYVYLLEISFVMLEKPSGETMTLHANKYKPSHVARKETFLCNRL